MSLKNIKDVKSLVEYVDWLEKIALTEDDFDFTNTKDVQVIIATDSQREHEFYIDLDSKQFTLLQNLLNLRKLEHQHQYNICKNLLNQINKTIEVTIKQITDTDTGQGNESIQDKQVNSPT